LSILFMGGMVFFCFASYLAGLFMKNEDHPRVTLFMSFAINALLLLVILVFLARALIWDVCIIDTTLVDCKVIANGMTHFF